MELKLENTEYGNYVQQLGTLPVFKAVHGLSSKWFNTQEEARQSALDWYQFELQSYKKNCAGKDKAYRAIETLQRGEG